MCEDHQQNVSYFDKFLPKIRKTWTPKEGEFPILDVFIHTTRLEISKLNIHLQHRHKNISFEEQKALSTLSARDDIIIKPADKGGSCGSLA
jgi:hypothetical protein